MHNRALTIHVDGMPILVVRKNIKNINLRITPPKGAVRISAPNHLTDAQIESAVLSRLTWIKTNQAKIRQRPRPNSLHYVSGEYHQYLGNAYLLEVIESNRPPCLSILNSDKMLLQIRPNSNEKMRASLMHEWYRAQLKKELPILLTHWQPIVHRQVNSWGIKKMKTRWGSCNIHQKRVWLNLELAKKPAPCLEYVLVHELVHLHEKYHNSNFYQLMDRFLPHWPGCKELLEQAL
jgi:predicted metal-dependent hydrolase